MNSRKQESTGGDDDTNTSKIFSKTTTTTTTPSSSSRQSSWAGFKNPRIVRVSRSFGGKDRHSKVCTVKGLRDRRIRLSVPTAIQLYDLQDRLGLSQPSKVVDWLIDASKHEIDKLPPLQMPPSSFSHLFNMKDNQDHDFVHHDPGLFGKEKWIATNHHEQQENNSTTNIISGGYNSTSANLFQSSSNFMPFNNWEPNSNLSLGPFGNNYHNFSSSQTDHNQCQLQNMSQLYFCPTTTTLSSSLHVNPPYNNNSHLNNFHPNSIMPTLQLISTPVKSSFSMNNKGINLQESDDDHENHREGSGS